MVGTLSTIILLAKLTNPFQAKRIPVLIPTRTLTTSKPKLYSNKRKTDESNGEEPTLASSELPKPKLDYRNLISEFPWKAENSLHRKSPSPPVTQDVLSGIYNQYKDTIRTINSGHHEQHSLGAQIQSAVQTKDSEKQTELREKAKQLRLELGKAKQDLDKLEQKLLSYSLMFPNDTHPSTPRSPESGPITLSTHGPPPIPSARSRDHLSICKAFNLLDFDSGSLVTGSSWYYLLNEAALLETALTQYALSLAIEDGFTPVITPDVVRADIAARCGFAPRESRGAASQMYHIASQEPHSPHPELVLAGTAEIPLAGMFANKIHPSNKLPYKVVGVGHAFRSEAGASAESRGLYRVHQFTKVELFAVTAQDQSEQMMESMKNLQRKILEGLGLPFRVMDMPTEELGASAYRKYDMEAWMPGRETWGEVSSLSNCTDYQARRLHIRYRPLTPKGSAPSEPIGSLPFAHTLNGTAAAIPRLIVALLENGVVFGEDGTVEFIRLPKPLKPFWIGNKRDVVRWDGEA